MAKCILVVDDDPDMRDVATMMFESIGYDVESAGDSEEVFRRIAKRPPDLIILDVMLTRENEGFEVLGQLKSDEETKGIPVLMMTGLDKSAGMEVLAENGLEGVAIEDFLSKPMDPGAYVAKVQKILGDA